MQPQAIYFDRLTSCSSSLIRKSYFYFKVPDGFFTHEALLVETSNRFYESVNDKEILGEARKIAGGEPINVPNVEFFNITDLLNGHEKLRSSDKLIEIINCVNDYEHLSDTLSSLQAKFVSGINDFLGK